MKDFAQWEGFEGNRWKEQINVRDFIRHNYTPYDGDDSFLEGPTEATNKLWGKLQELQKAERANNGVLDMETKVVTGLTAYGPGYIDEDLKNLEKVVGLQTDKPLKRAFMPYGGIKMAEQADAVLQRAEQAALCSHEEDDDRLDDEIDLVRHTGGQLHALCADLQRGKEQGQEHDGQRLVAGDHGNHEALKIIVAADAVAEQMLRAVHAEHADQAAQRAGKQHTHEYKTAGADTDEARKALVLARELHLIAA